MYFFSVVLIYCVLDFDYFDTIFQFSGLSIKRQGLSMDQVKADVTLVPAFVLNSLYNLREASKLLVRPIVLKNCNHRDDPRESYSVCFNFYHVFRH